MDTLGHLSDGLVGLYSCHGAGGNQDWSLTKNGHIKHGSELCVSLEAPKASTNLRLRLCSNSPLQVRTEFIFTYDNYFDFRKWLKINCVLNHDSKAAGSVYPPAFRVVLFYIQSARGKSLLELWGTIFLPD